MPEEAEGESLLPSRGRLDSADGTDAEAAAGTAKKGISLQLCFLTCISGIGGFLFGFDTGVVSGALPYLRDDLLAPYAGNPSRLNWLQEVVVSATVIGAGLSSAAGGAFSDAYGRKRALILGDALFAAGAALLAAAFSVQALIWGRALVGLGVGLASVTVPAYIAECAPPRVRATLVTINVFMITFGQFAAYLSDYLFTFVPGTWRWMLGVAGVPAVLQLVGLLFLPESPRWLAAQGHTERAQQALQALRGVDHSTHAELDQLLAAVAADKSLARTRPWDALRSPVLRYQLHVGGVSVRFAPVAPFAHFCLGGVGLQVLQQAAGINTAGGAWGAVMYFTPSILELAGFRNKRTALLVALLPAGVNAAGTVVGALAIDHAGRRRLLLASLVGVVLALLLLGGAFSLAEGAAPSVEQGPPSSCPVRNLTDCNACIHAGCAFCGPAASPALAGACVAPREACPPQHWAYPTGCPSPFTSYILVALVVYLAAFSPGLGPVPWAVNAEIFPLQMRGLGSGVAATANWATNAVVSQTFLTLTQALGGSGAFWLYACIAAAGLAWAYCLVPETAGLSLEEVQEACAARCHMTPQPPPQLPDQS